VDEAAHAPDLDAPPNRWEIAAVWAARHLSERVRAIGADAVLAGAGVANLAAWLGVQQARAAGSSVQLTAEIGLWGYDPTPADPFVLNHRNFPRSGMLGDAAMVLGSLVGGAGTTTVACLGGAQVDRFGNVNSTLIPDGPFLVGSGGGNDVASVCAEAIVVALLAPERTPAECGYVTSPGRAVRALVTDLGTFEKLDPAGELVLTTVPDGPGSIDARVDAARAACGWDLAVAPEVGENSQPTADEVSALRRWDPQAWFLRDR
jgi:acyl CoA:acetate/3-ketoacid CoA transferase beta subunit